MSATPDLISGEWLLDLDADDDGNTYSTVYAARVTGAWSGGVYALVTRTVMEAIVRDQSELAAGVEDVDRLEWDGDAVVHTAPIDDDFVNRIEPDGDGLYAVPGWTWCRVDPAVDRFACVVGTVTAPAQPALTERELRDLADTWVDTGEPSYMDAVFRALDAKRQP